jgi:hypothetical protein
MMKMRVRTFKAYFEVIEILEAQEQTHRLIAAGSVMSTPEGKKQLMDSYSNIARDGAPKHETARLITDPAEVRRWFTAQGV